MVASRLGLFLDDWRRAYVMHGIFPVLNVSMLVTHVLCLRNMYLLQNYNLSLFCSRYTQILLYRQSLQLQLNSTLFQVEILAVLLDYFFINFIVG